MTNWSDIDTIQSTIQKAIQKNQIKLTPLQIKVLVEIAVLPTRSRAEMARNIGVGEGDVNNSISALKKKGLLIREGRRRYGQWHITLERED